MSRHFSRLGIGLAALASLGGCLSPHENFYTLDAVRPTPPQTGPLVTIVVGPVALPPLVDRPQLVVREGDNKVKVLEQERWATPLKESLPRLLADELSQRLPDRRFVAAGSRAIAATGGRLVVDFTRFDVTEVSGAHVRAHWIYRPVESETDPVEGDSDVQIKPTLAGYESLVDALQRASLALGDDIAGHLKPSGK